MEDARRRRADALYRARFDEGVSRLDRLFAELMIAQWVVALLLAVTVAPIAWATKTQVAPSPVLVAGVGGAIVSVPACLLGFLRPTRTSTRMVIAVSQMGWSAILSHLTAGRIETHFHVFGSLALLSFYRDWRVFVPATVVVVVDRLARQAFFPESVYGTAFPEWWRFLEHGAWVGFENVFLVLSCVRSSKEVKRWAAQQAHIEVTNRIEREMQIAATIQSSILPKRLAVPGLEIAAKLVPATETGGDYYEVLPVAGGAWLAIGDVAGHGLKAGLVMLQAQSAMEALIKDSPNGRPSRILSGVNRMLYENVRHRLGSDEHMTMALYRYFDDGSVITAGAHEETILWRAATGKCELVPVTGTWLGAMESIDEVTPETMLELGAGDVMVLYTDGVTEGRSARKEAFGIERLCALVEASASEPAEAICAKVFAAVTAWTGGRQDDDVTVVVLRHRPLRP